MCRWATIWVSSGIETVSREKHRLGGGIIETGNVEEMSVVSEGYRPGTQTMRLPRTLDQRPKSQQDKRMFYASKAEALAMLAQDGT